MKIAVVGTKYDGVVTGPFFAETGNKVTSVDIDKSKVEKLSAGATITAYDPEAMLNIKAQIGESLLC